MNADPNQKNRNGEAALTLAAAASSSRLLPWLLSLSSSWDLDIQDNEGRTALMIAVMNKNVENVEALLHAGASVQITDNENSFALSYALPESLDDDDSIKIFNLLLSWEERS